MPKDCNYESMEKTRHFAAGGLAKGEGFEVTPSSEGHKKGLVDSIHASPEAGNTNFRMHRVRNRFPTGCNDKGCD